MMNYSVSVIIGIALIGVSCLAAQTNTSENSPWQGEWVSTGGNNNSGITVKNCDPAGKCDVGIFEFDNGGGISCLRQADSNLKDDGSLLASTHPFGTNERSCRLDIKKDGEFLRVSQAMEGGDCSGPCVQVQADEEKFIVSSTK
jgi:hypothetical protein